MRLDPDLCQQLDFGEVGDLVVAAFNQVRTRLDESLMAQGFEELVKLRGGLGGGAIGPRMPDPVG